MENSGGKTQPVGEKRANAWGLHDMHATVWEWCEDWYDSAYYAGSPRQDPTGSSSRRCRVLRGGSWGNAPEACRSASRRNNTPDYRLNGIGFRVVRTP